jgi:hypothetical protein
MSNAINTLGDYHVPTYKPSYVNKFHVCLIAVVGLAVSALLFALLS